MSPDVESEAAAAHRLMTQPKERDATAPFQREAGVTLLGCSSRGIIHFRRRHFLTVWLPSLTPSDTL